MDIWEWREKVVKGKVKDARQNGSIIMFDQTLSRRRMELRQRLAVQGHRPGRQVRQQ